MGFNNPSNYTPVLYGSPNPHAGETKIGNYSTGTKYANATQLRNQANTNKYPLNDYSADDRFRTAGGMYPNRGLTPEPNKPTGGISFSLGGGRGGGASVPSDVLITRQFPTYESTWTPPAAVTPEPYDWATRDPYIYGNGLSNAGAAYDIWGSKPGENPYVMTTPSDYTPGLLGMQPVTLPDNVPSTNVGGPNVPSGTPDRQKFTGTPEQIIRDYGYYDRTAPMQNNVPPSMRDSAPNAQVMLDAARINWKKGHYPSMQAAMDAQVAFSKKYPALTPAENAAQIAASQKMMNERFKKPVVDTTPKKTLAQIAADNRAAKPRIPSAGTGASGPPGRNYGSSTKSIPATTKKSIDKLISTKKSTMGSGSNWQRNPHSGGF